MMERDILPTAKSIDDYREQFAKLSENTGANFFHLRATLPKQGRTDTILAASKTMSVILKTYAVSGENGLHRHPVEDHVFIVLQGEADFYGPEGATRRVSKYDGVFLPSTAYYCFKSVGDEALVMIRVGAKTNPDADPLARVDKLDEPVDGYGKANKTVELVLDEGNIFE